MTCKDCYHYDACMDYTSLKESIFAQNFNGSDTICDHFKDKSRIVELPCKVGDKVYKLTRNKVKECEVVFIGISADEKCSYFNFVENYADGTFYKSYSMVFDVIGKTVFLTREEAEAKLKEVLEQYTQNFLDTRPVK